jgi:hypothetical protein
MPDVVCLICRPSLSPLRRGFARQLDGGAGPPEAQERTLHSDVGTVLRVGNGRVHDSVSISVGRRSRGRLAVEWQSAESAGLSSQEVLVRLCRLTGGNSGRSRSTMNANTSDAFCSGDTTVQPNLQTG